MKDTHQITTTPLNNGAESVHTLTEEKPILEEEKGRRYQHRNGLKKRTENTPWIWTLTREIIQIRS